MVRVQNGNATYTKFVLLINFFKINWFRVINSDIFKQFTVINKYKELHHACTDSLICIYNNRNVA